MVKTTVAAKTIAILDPSFIALMRNIKKSSDGSKITVKLAGHKIEYIKRMNGWIPCLDVRIDGVNYYYNNHADQEAVDFWVELMHAAYDERSAKHETVSKQNAEWVELLTEQGTCL